MLRRPPRSTLTNTLSLHVALPSCRRRLGGRCDPCRLRPEVDGHRGAEVGRRIHRDAAMVQSAESARDGEPEPGAAMLPRHAAFRLPEQVEDAAEVIGLDADAGIADRDAQAGAEAAGADVDAAAGGIELDDVADHLGQPVAP